MTKKIYLAFLWHHHQPYYRIANGAVTFQMPWVRLHGIKDYYGMAALIAQFPKIKSNINLVPSLLKQIKEYVAGETDRLLFLSQRPSSELNPEDKQYILENGFLAHPQNMIGACARYKELYTLYQTARQRVLAEKSQTADNLLTNSPQNGQALKKLLKNLTEQDFTDILVCSSQVWFHPLIIERDKELQALRAKGRNYTEEDKKLLVQKQLHYLSEIIPLHKKLQDSGQIEITTTPFYHPILPLLCNMNSTLQAMPQAALPAVDQKALFEDARLQMAEAMKFYREHFGIDARGIWPSEGSVAPSMAPLLLEQNVRYFASDEEILAHTLDRSSDHFSGFLNDLYQPYKTRGMSVIFRDQYLSNLIGFQYQRWKASDAAEHLINEIKAGASRTHQEAPLVSIILDGENPWEHYPNNGIEFLRLLYERLSNDAEIETVRISDYIEKHPPVKELDTIYAGSWINHNFSIWVGHKEDRDAWEYLAKTREMVSEQKAKGAEQSKIDRAMESIYIAEGSDWYWWFGHEHSSALDDQFDLLFRKHLMNAYQVLGVNVPEYLHHQIKERRQKELHTLPWGLLDIKLDGKRSDYFEWLPAGQFDPASESGAAMDRSSDLGRIISRIFFGFDKHNLCLRIDPAANGAKGAPAFPDGIYFVLNFLKPLRRKVIIPVGSERSKYDQTAGDSKPQALDASNGVIRDISVPAKAGREGKDIVGPLKPRFSILDESGAPRPVSGGEGALAPADKSGAVIREADTVATGEIVEILCPLDGLGFKPGEEVQFFVEAYSILGGGDKPCDCSLDRLMVRHPESLPIKLAVPAEDLAHIDWIA
ncbi:MAG: glycoside hydrolase family 57 protein [Planctomycetota bacterium]